MWSRAIAGVMGALFLGFTWVQLDDPDWPRWVGVYGLAGLLSMAATAGRRWRSISGPLCLVALVWSATLLPELRHVQAADLLGRFGMDSPAAEEAREGLGLLMVALWAAVLSVR